MDYRENGLGKQSEVTTVPKSEWKTIGVRIKAKDLALYNRRLSLNNPRHKILTNLRIFEYFIRHSSCRL